MDLRHLRYFVAVAEERHFTRAAERLGIKQPPLSLQIRQLEQELGTPLFRRLTRGLELTEPGTLLLDEARQILEQVERTKANVRNRARGETGHIRAGFAGATYFQPRVPGLIQAYRECYPNVLLSPVQSNTPHLIEAMRNGSVDVAFVRPPLGDGEGLTVHALVEEPMRIVLPSNHPQARERSVSLATLAHETFILFPRTIGPGLHDSIIASCQRAGYVTGWVELLQEHHRVVSRSIRRPAMRAGLRSGHSDRWTALDVTRSAFLSTLACYRLRSRRQAPGLTPTACLKTRVRWLWSPAGGQWHAATVRRVQSRLG
jgi:DNA-binding transcriptional LysR family regulator